MAKIRLLKGVAHDITDSFASLMNNISACYMDYIVAISQRDKIRNIEVNFLKETISPKNYQCEESSKVIKGHKDWFYDRVTSLGFSKDDFQSVIMHITIKDIRNSDSNPMIKKHIDISLRTTILMTNEKEIDYQLDKSWLYCDEQYYKKVIEDVEGTGYENILVSPQLDMIAYFSNQIFGETKTSVVTSFIKSPFKTKETRSKIIVLISLLSKDEIDKTYLRLDYISRRLYYANGYDLKRGDYFKPLLNPRVFGVEFPEYEIIEKGGSEYIKIRFDMWDDQSITIEQKLSFNQEMTEVDIRYTYENVSQSTFDLIHKDTKFFYNLFDRVFHFEKSTIRLIEQKTD